MYITDYKYKKQNHLNNVYVTQGFFFYKVFTVHYMVIWDLQ